ncbi:glycosyltransferase involved in cell wall biosynthesis [Aequitasia blattaphilus]|uniref:Glycosyltransferase n=1 Tax=Aequitasia blattaphilus TaxID=2949332 RepID=A0ABT1E691_9FIRM|nr:glycosyltransferase [Aequitasia blattaphilus]MCP1101360.1 glycosyltransferase [Aequitasia blattaphilus]MCR8614000.1 glycosyltransferase [Aequitasia blattaphilus]
MKKAVQYLKKYGIKPLLIKGLDKVYQRGFDYSSFYEKQKAGEETLQSQREASLSLVPLISILVPVYDAPNKYLEEMLKSVENQSYENWELCIANGNPGNKENKSIIEKFTDHRIRVVELEENKGISENTNHALSMAQGEFIGLLDHDDVLAPNALFEYVKLLNEDPSLDMIYSDEDKIKEMDEEHFLPNFKPEFNLDLLRSNNYITHFLVVRRELALKVGGFHSDYDGAQDHDFLFRCIENTNKIKHIDKVLYHWRVHENSTADNPYSKTYAYDSGVKAISDHLTRWGDAGKVSKTNNPGFYHIDYEKKGNPKVLALVKGDFSYFKSHTDYDNVTFCSRKEVRDKDCEFMVFLEEGMVIKDSKWLDKLVASGMRRDVGMVGVKLVDRKGRYQHAGIFAGEGDVKYIFQGMPRILTGYMHRGDLFSEVSAVSLKGALIKKQAFDLTGGFLKGLSEEERSVDLAFRIREQGYRIVYNSDVMIQRKKGLPDFSETSKEKLSKIHKERMKKRDPYYYYNPKEA